MLQTALARVGAFHAAACGRVLVATLLAAVMGACAFATTGERELASDSSVVGSCQRDTVRTALLRAARAWADGDAGATAAISTTSSTKVAGAI